MVETAPGQLGGMQRNRHDDVVTEIEENRVPGKQVDERTTGFGVACVLPPREEPGQHPPFLVAKAGPGVAKGWRMALATPTEGARPGERAVDAARAADGQEAAASAAERGRARRAAQSIAAGAARWVEKIA